MRSSQDPPVHHGQHFRHVIHSFCSVLMLLTNRIAMMGEVGKQDLETFMQGLVSLHAVEFGLGHPSQRKKGVLRISGFAQVGAVA